jgi:hypothetical protein
MASLIMLIFWEVWNERNAIVFSRHQSTVCMVINKIKAIRRRGRSNRATGQTIRSKPGLALGRDRAGRVLVMQYMAQVATGAGAGPCRGGRSTGRSDRA